MHLVVFGTHPCAHADGHLGAVITPPPGFHRNQKAKAAIIINKKITAISFLIFYQL
jgi:hypothetical protein